LSRPRALTMGASCQTTRRQSRATRDPTDAGPTCTPATRLCGALTRGGIGDGCGGTTTFTPTATPATTPATTPTDLLVLACEHYGIGLSDAMFNSCLARVTAGESARTVVGALTMDETGVSL